MRFALSAVSEMKCSMPGCKNDTDYHISFSLSYFSIPTEKDLRQMWLNAMGRNDISQNAVVCSDHFNRNDLIKLNKKFMLAHHAIPVNPAPPPVDNDPKYAIEILETDIEHYIQANRLVSTATNTDWQLQPLFSCDIINRSAKIQRLESKLTKKNTEIRRLRKAIQRKSDKLQELKNTKRSQGFRPKPRNVKLKKAEPSVDVSVVHETPIVIDCTEVLVSRYTRQRETSTNI